MKYLSLLTLLPLVATAGEQMKKPMPQPIQQRQQQDQGQAQGQEQTQSASAAAGATATNANAQNVDLGVSVAFQGGDTNVEFQAADIPDNTPSVTPGSLFPANACHMVFNVGGSVPGFGITGGKTYIDKNCQELEWIRMGYSIGMRDAAVWQWCSMPHGAKNPKCSEVQDYNREVQMLILDNEHLLNDYQKQKDRADKLESEESERRLKAAVEK